MRHSSLTGLSRATPNPFNSGPKALQFLTVIVFVALLLAVGLAVLCYRLYEIDHVINRTLVFRMLNAGMVVTYILLADLFGTLFDTNVDLAAAMLTIALTAFLFQSMRTRLKRCVARVISSTPDPANTTGTDESDGEIAFSGYGRFAWGIAALSLALIVIGATAFLVVLVNGNKQWPAPHLYFSPVLTLTFSLVGALMASHHQRNPIGWIFIAVGFLSALNLDAPAYRMFSQRPPALDALGLVGALRQAAATAQNGLHIEVDVPEPLPPLSAAVEVAAYRIPQETLNNAARHAHAQCCVLWIYVRDALWLVIQDDGVGLPRDVRAGVGLVSVREQAGELGGTCEVESTPGHGARVIARLPLAQNANNRGSSAWVRTFGFWLP